MRRKFPVLLIVLVLIALVVGGAIISVPYRTTAQTILIESYPTTDAVVQALMKGDVDLAPLENAAPQTLTQLKNNPALNVVPIPNFGFTYIGFNLREAPLNNTVFREAMLYGFDRQRSLSEALAGYGELLSPGLLSSAYAKLGLKNESIDSFAYNPEKASELLDSVGFVQSSSGMRINPSTGQTLHTMFIFSRLCYPEDVAAADLFAEDMRSIGLPVISFPESDFDFNMQVKVTYLFDMYIDTQSASAAPTWLHDLFAGVNDKYPVPLGSNLVGYHNATFDECAKQLMTNTDPNSAKEAALACQEELSLDLPALPVYSKNLLILTQRTFPQLIPIAGSITDTIARTLKNMTMRGSVRIGEVSGLGDINPATSLGNADLLALALLTEPLLTYDTNGALQPGLVREWRMTDNSTNLTFILREGQRFQDGSPIVAPDLVATLDWLIGNMIPSSPLYPALSQIKTVTEVDNRTVTISLRESNSFAAYAFANLFILPGRFLPAAATPLALLRAGSLGSSGAFTLLRFVQGAEVELASVQPSLNQVILSGVQGEGIFGRRIGGSQIQILSQPLTYKGQTIDNATFTVHIFNVDEGSELTLQGSYVGLGIYRVNLNLNEQSLTIGEHRIMTQLYGQLPSGAIMEFGEGTLSIHPPQLLLQAVVCVVALAAVGMVAYNVSHRKARRPAKRRVARRRKARVSRRRKKR